MVPFRGAAPTSRSGLTEVFLGETGELGPPRPEICPPQLSAPTTVTTVYPDLILGPKQWTTDRLEPETLGVKGVGVFTPSVISKGGCRGLSHFTITLLDTVVRRAEHPDTDLDNGVGRAPDSERPDTPRRRPDGTRESCLLFRGNTSRLPRTLGDRNPSSPDERGREVSQGDPSSSKESVSPTLCFQPDTSSCPTRPMSTGPVVDRHSSLPGKRRDPVEESVQGPDDTHGTNEKVGR